MKRILVRIKARRRIRRFIKTGEHQARVYPTSDENVYEYKVIHHVKSIYYRKGRFGLRRVKYASTL